MINVNSHEKSQVMETKTDGDLVSINNKDPLHSTAHPIDIIV